MKKVIFSFFLFLTIQQISFAQGQQLQLEAGRSYTGSGDMGGWAFTVGYEKRIKKQLSWEASVGANIYTDTKAIFYEDSFGEQKDASIRIVTAGFQVAHVYGYHFLKKNDKDLFFKMGGLFRYQANSFDGAGIYYPIITNMPFPLVLLDNRFPQNTISLGAISKIGFSSLLTRNLTLGLTCSFQLDTNGDNIMQLMLIIGRKF